MTNNNYPSQKDLKIAGLIKQSPEDIKVGDICLNSLDKDYYLVTKENWLENYYQIKNVDTGKYEYISHFGLNQYYVAVYSTVSQKSYTSKYSDYSNYILE